MDYLFGGRIVVTKVRAWYRTTCFLLSPIHYSTRARNGHDAREDEAGRLEATQGQGRGGLVLFDYYVRTYYYYLSIIVFWPLPKFES